MSGYYGNGFSGFNGIGSCFRNGFMNGYGYGSNGWSLLIFFGILAITALLIVFIAHNSNKKKQYNDALEILKMKYVRGEITEEDYIRRKSVLEH
jgi:putative membrane protein